MRMITGVVSIVLFFSPAAGACSFSTSTYFKEVARSFSVAVQFEGKPLAAANVSILSFDTIRSVSSATTARNGTVRFRDLRPGKYYVEVHHLGIPAAFDQIEIRARVSAQAKSTLDYRWGDALTTVRQISGKIMDIRRQGATLVEQFTNPPLEIPIRGAQIQLRHPTDGSVYSDASDEQGEFALAGVPNGIYVMHVRDGVTPDDSANFLVRVTPTATTDSVQLIRGDLCGGPVLQLRP